MPLRLLSVLGPVWSDEKRSAEGPLHTAACLRAAQQAEFCRIPSGRASQWTGVSRRVTRVSFPLLPFVWTSKRKGVALQRETKGESNA